MTTDREVERRAIATAIRELIAQGYDTPVNKRDQCEHGKFGWEECIACYDIEWLKLADAIERGEHLEGGEATSDNVRDVLDQPKP